MTFLSPIWLLALLPWAGLVIWQLIRRPCITHIPFARLWNALQEARRGDRRRSRPPLVTLLLLAAMAAAILAAARPALNAPQPVASPITIVVDRGLTMSSTRAGRLRFRQLAAEAYAALVNRLARHQRVELILLPGGSSIHTDAQGWLGHVNPADPTAVDTGPLLRQTVHSLLHGDSGYVIVLSDQPPHISNPRLIDIVPPDASQSAVIIAVAARPLPHPQIMVGLRNESSLGRATLNIHSGDMNRRIEVTLPPAPQTRNVFVDLPSPGPMIRLHLEMDSSCSSPADHAYLVRSHRPIRAVAASSLPASMQRLMELYNQSQPSGDDPLIVSAASDPSGLPPDHPGVLFVSGDMTATGSYIIDSSPITAHMDWNEVLEDAALATPPQGQWHSIVRVGDHPAVMIQAGPPRRLWVGISSSKWPKSPDYVIFWKNAFDWLGGGGGSYVAQAAGAIALSWRPVHTSLASSTPGLWPGIYRNSAGNLLAVNAPDVPPPQPAPTPWREQLQHLSTSQGGSGNPPRWLYTAAIALVAAAAWAVSR